MSSELSEILEKVLISDRVLWNNGCISQGRLAAVSDSLKSLWPSTVTVWFSFTSQVRTMQRFYGPGQEVAFPPFCPHCGMWLHLNEKGMGNVI